MIKLWTDAAWEDYVWWQSQDRRTLKRINQLIKDIERDPFSGLGKPDTLRFELSGKWTRRIDDRNRLIYRIEGDMIFFYSCKDHYAIEKEQ